MADNRFLVQFRDLARHHFGNGPLNDVSLENLRKGFKAGCDSLADTAMKGLRGHNKHKKTYQDFLVRTVAWVTEHEEGLKTFIDVLATTRMPQWADELAKRVFMSETDLVAAFEQSRVDLTEQTKNAIVIYYGGEEINPDPATETKPPKTEDDMSEITDRIMQSAGRQFTGIAVEEFSEAMLAEFLRHALRNYSTRYLGMKTAKTNYEGALRFLIALLAIVGKHEVGMKVFKETVEGAADRGLLPKWAGVASEAFVGSAEGAREGFKLAKVDPNTTLDKMISELFDEQSSTVTSEEEEDSEEESNAKKMSRTDALALIKKLKNPGKRRSLRVLSRAISADRRFDSIEIPGPDDEDELTILTVRNAGAEALEVLPRDITEEDETTLNSLLEAYRAAINANDDELDGALATLQQQQTATLLVLSKYEDFFIFCRMVSARVGIRGVGSSIKFFALSVLDDFNTVERRLLARREALRLAQRAEEIGRETVQVVGRTAIANLWFLTMGILTSLSISLTGYLGRHMWLIKEGGETLYSVDYRLPAGLWLLFWGLTALAGVGLTGHALIRAADNDESTTSNPDADLRERFRAFVAEVISRTNWRQFTLGVMTIIYSMIITVGAPLFLLLTVSGPSHPTLFWSAAAWLGGLLSLGVFAWGALTIETVLNFVRHLLSSISNEKSDLRLAIDRYLLGLENSVGANRGTLANIIGKKSILGRKVTGVLVLILLLPGVATLAIGPLESIYVDYAMYEAAGDLRLWQGRVSIGVILTWVAITIGILVVQRHNMQSEVELIDVGESVKTFYRVLRRAAVTLLVLMFVVPCGHGGLTFGFQWHDDNKPLYEVCQSEADVEEYMQKHGIDDDHPDVRRCRISVDRWSLKMTREEALLKEEEERLQKLLEKK